LFTSEHIAIVPWLPVGRVDRYNPVELHIVDAFAAGGSAASEPTCVVMDDAATAMTAGSKVAVVVWSAAAPVMENVDQSEAGGWLPNALVYPLPVTEAPRAAGRNISVASAQSRINPTVTWRLYLLVCMVLKEAWWTEAKSAARGEPLAVQNI
jgi:hypothetical protein